MGKSVGKKIIAMLVLMGVITVSVCIFNMVELKVIRDCSNKTAEYIESYSTAVEAGDEELAFESAAAVVVSGERVGMSIRNAAVFNLIQLAVVVLATAAIIAAASLSIVRPAKAAGGQLQEIVNDVADLTKRMDVNSSDEIGQLAGGINLLMDSLQELAAELREETRTMEDSAYTTLEGIEKIGKDADGVAAVTKRLSDDMEELCAAMGRLSLSGDRNIETASDMCRRADDVKKVAVGVKECAEEVHRKAVASKVAAQVLMDSSGGRLEQAIKDIRNVKRIDELAGNVINIAGHLDLLALNVSIEAARAGDAGKSFASAASEIKLFANSSRDAAGGIRKISGDVMQAVERVGENAGELLSFVSDDVVKGYGEFENTASQYAKDSGIMSGILDSLAGKASDIKETVQQMGKEIKSVSTTARVDSDGVSRTAQAAEALAKSIAETEDEAAEGRRIAEGLREKLDRFKKV